MLIIFPQLVKVERKAILILILNRESLQEYENFVKQSLVCINQIGYFEFHTISTIVAFPVIFIALVSTLMPSLMKSLGCVLQLNNKTPRVGRYLHKRCHSYLLMSGVMETQHTQTHSRTLASIELRRQMSLPVRSN